MGLRHSALENKLICICNLNSCRATPINRNLRKVSRSKTSRGAAGNSNLKFRVDANGIFQ
jgi:hypothetical protein